MVFCANCGYDLSSKDFNFCPRCGNSTTLQKKEMPSTTQPSIKNQNGKGDGLIMCGVLIIIAIIVTLFFMILTGYAYSYLQNYVEKSVNTCNLAIELSNPGLAEECHASKSRGSPIMIVVIVLFIVTLIGIYIILRAIYIFLKAIRLKVG